MAGTTHVAWKLDMENAIEIVRALASRNQARADALGAAGGGDVHMALLAERVESLTQAARAGEQITAAADGVHIPVGEAMAAAGRGWVAEKKEFNTAG